MSNGAKGKPEEHEEVSKILAGDRERILNAHDDIPDIRDRIYEPALLDLKTVLHPPRIELSPVLDQLSEGACTGFALAGAINLLRNRRGSAQGDARSSEPVSPRMLYEMARLHDEWPGEDYEGSSIRGVLKGFFHNGACSEKAAPYKSGETEWFLTVDQSKDARNNGLGAYFRLRPEIIDYHAALNEVGAIVASAQVHRGWRNPAGGKIKRSSVHEGGHAFMIVGYDDEGLLIQNSWGREWGGYRGHPGTAHWSYADWAENIVDAWVLRLAVPTPEAFDLTHVPVRKALSEKADKPAPRRHDILGHFVHLDDGKLVEKGRYGTNIESIRKTAAFLAEDSGNPKPKYDHILLYAHGGLNGTKASARRILALKEGFKRNRIYPIHFMWETGFAEELGDIFKDLFTRSEERVGSARDLLDWTIEKTTLGIGRPLWREMKSGAVKAFEKDAAGWQAVSALLAANASSKKPKKVHLAGHSAGSILLGEMIKRWDRISKEAPQIASVSLMAPACTLEFYEGAYRAALSGKQKNRKIASLWQYLMVDSRETQDETMKPYGKSLLYLVSNAFEVEKETPLLGMEKFVEHFTPPAAHKLWFAGRDPAHTDSVSHGGFDNDRSTMNDILAHILSKKPSAAMRFQQVELDF